MGCLLAFPIVSCIIRYEVVFNICFGFGDTQFWFLGSLLDEPFECTLRTEIVFFTAIYPHDASNSKGSLQGLAGKFFVESREAEPAKGRLK